ncbi:MAG: IS4 family transposase [Syntrophobacteraceae bacterium]|nr:IS4 family transposase [Syntrophobacteraceae bacterium]MDR3713537.1 IS4 family transposase [Puia sp.]
MARTLADLPEGTRLTDYISLGVIAATFPLAKVHEILRETKRTSERQRDLPAHVVLYYVIALALYMQSSYQEVLRCLLEGIRWLLGPDDTIKVTGKSGISQARTRLGAEPLQRLYDGMVRPIAQANTRGAFYRNWKVVSIDGTTLDVADTDENEKAFGRPKASRGQSGFPQIRLVALVENGTHVLFGSQIAGCRTGEATLANLVVNSIQEGMLCLADRYYFSYQRWTKACKPGAALLWRVKAGMNLPCNQRLADGSYLSKIYRSTYDRRKDRKGVVVRVIEYTLEGVADAEPMYRLLTTLLEPAEAPANELAALYHERWEIETALDELKTHLRGARIVLRSKTPELVRQEVYGLLLAHFAIRGLMHEAALKGDVDADQLSFLHSVRVVRRKLPRFVAAPP